MLATTLNSLALASRSTTEHWLACAILSCPVLLSALSFSLFSLAFLAYFSTFAHATKFAIGLELCLALDVCDTHLHATMSGRVTLDTFTPQLYFTYAAVTLYRNVFQRFSVIELALKEGPNPTSAPSLRRGFGLRCSLFVRTTKGISVDFFSFTY